MSQETNDGSFLDDDHRSRIAADTSYGKWRRGDDNIMTTLPTITKADGSVVVFNPALLIRSLERAGAGEYTAKKITDTVVETTVPGMSSSEVYGRAFTLLRRESRPVAARYSLRRALLDLGPTGHPFEDFVSHLYQTLGWRVETRKMIQGHCVMHEVDFYASHPEQNTYIAAELKYHNDPNYKTDLKVALYVKSRFDDIFTCDPKIRECPIDRGLLVTNTKFTSEAITYAECAGVELLGWGYPVHDSLFMQMNRNKVYPITSLTQLSRGEKRLLIDDSVIAVDQIIRDRRLLDILHLSPEKIGDIIAEAEGLLSLPEVSRDTVSL